MKLPETPKAALFEKEKWESIVNSPEWIVYRNALKEHIAYLQNESNGYLRTQKFTEAFGSLRAMDDSKKFLDSITIKISQLNGIIEKGGK